MYSRFTYLMRSALAVSVLLTAPAWADSYKGPTPPAVYTQECGSCHLAFPSNLLPKASWQRVMNGLDKHYGSDASLDQGLGALDRSGAHSGRAYFVFWIVGIIASTFEPKFDRSAIPEMSTLQSSPKKGGCLYYMQGKYST